ncbi:MAG: hypothetical protein K0B14_14500 [Anaerolineaceae bacterium]|nr:hypothetical protein [Anaerolineaceae bacterium]
MTTVSYYLDRLKSIFDIPSDSNEINLSFEWETQAEAKIILSKIIIMQKELRLLKKEINSTIKSIRLKYSEDKSNVGTGFSSLFRNRTIGKLNSIQKQSIRKKELSEIEPYQNILRNIDGIMIELDKIKIKLKENDPE